MTAPATQDTPPAPALDTEKPAKATKQKAEPAAPKRGLGDALREFEPDLRWFLPAVASCQAYTLAAIPVWTGLPSWVLVAPGVASTAAGVWLARHFYKAVEYGHEQRRAAQAIAVGAGVLMTAWMVFAGGGNPLRPVALGALLLVALVCGAAFGALHTRAPSVKAEVKAKRTEVIAAGVERVAEVEQAKARDEWQEIAEQANPGCGITLVQKVPQEGGFYLDFADNPTKPIKWQGFCGMVGSMLSIASARMAPDGVTLSEGDLCPEQPEGMPAHLFRLHVYTSNKFAASLPYPMDVPVGTILDPRILGKYKDMSPLGVCLCGNHGVMCAGTGGGKTVFANCLIAGVLECGDAEVWLGATDKLTPLAYSWLLPWLLGRTREPVLKYVSGQSARSVTEMLAELYHEAKRRNGKLGRQSKHTPSRDEPAIVCVIEEASDLLMDHSDVVVTTFDGHRWNASQLLNALARAARSASISIFLLTQFGIMDALGGHGSLMRRNLTFRVCGRTYTYSDGRDILTAISAPDTTKLKDYTLLVQPALAEPRVIPAKAWLLDGAETIGPIAEKYTSRRTNWVPPLAGDAFRERWSATRLPELAAIAADEGLPWPGSVHTGSPVVDEIDQVALPAAEPDKESDSMSDEVKAKLAAANAKMDEAIEQARKYGPLGPLMGPIMDAVNAENAPGFVPAGLLAHIIGRVPDDGDWDTAGDKLAGELQGKPWYLSPTRQEGTLGWPRDLILGTIRAFLEGRPVPGEGAAEGMDMTAGETLGVLVRKLAGDNREFVTAVDAAAMVGMSAAALQRMLEGEPFKLPMQRPRTVTDGERPRGWFVSDLRRAAGV
jgi:F0F1-type ATP synthase membrane subunit b/b'